MKKRLLYVNLLLLSLLATNFSSAQTVYEIALADLINQNSTCSTVPNQTRYKADANSWGFSWTSTGAASPSSVTIEFFIGIDCGVAGYSSPAGELLPITLNGTYETDYATTATNLCNCDPTNPILSTFVTTGANYNAGGLNTVLIAPSAVVATTEFGFMMNPAWSNAYARVTVDYCDGLTTTASALTLCSADMLTLTATSSNGGNITWDNGVVDGTAFQPNTVGTVNYTATSDHVDDCPFTYSINVLESPEFNLTPTSEFVNGDGGISLTLISGLFPFTYDWDNDGTGDFDDNQNLDLVPAGTYAVTVSHSNGCTRTKSATITSQVSIEDNEIELLAVFPNPTSHSAMIEYSGNFNYEIVNVVGEVLISGSAKDKVLVNLTELTNGNYFVKVNSNDSILTKKIVKM